jgi:hypothetical protein
MVNVITSTCGFTTFRSPATTIDTITTGPQRSIHGAMLHPQLSRLPGAEVTACGFLSGGATIHQSSEGGRTKNTVELHGMEDAAAICLSFRDNGSVDPLWSAIFDSKANGTVMYKLDSFVANSKTLADGTKLGFLIYDLAFDEDGHITKAGSAMIWPPEWVPRDPDNDGKRTVVYHD